jgi:hypothetical protein
MKFEFSSPQTPSTQQQGGKKVPNFFGRIRDMINSAGVKDQLRSGVWAEYEMTVTFLFNVKSIKNKEVYPYELLIGCEPKLPTSLRSFGEISLLQLKSISKVS